MSTLETKKIEPLSGTSVTLGAAGDAVTMPAGVTVKTNTVKDAGGNTLWTSDGSGTLSSVNSALQGNMVFISSIYGVVGNDQRIYRGSNLAELYADSDSETKREQVYSHSVYPVVKGGIISFARYLSAYWGDKNIRVNCISPGGVYHEGENENFLKKYSEKVPLGRKAEVSEVSGAVVFLASDLAGYITGHNLIIDGGWTSW